MEQGNKKKKRNTDEVTKPKHKRYKYSHDTMIKALNEIENEHISLNGAARKYNLPRSTLFDKLKGRTPRERNIGHKPYLTNEEENDLIE